jgi:hypothetical protein
MEDRGDGEECEGIFGGGREHLFKTIIASKFSAQNALKIV